MGATPWSPSIVFETLASRTSRQFEILTPHQANQTAGTPRNGRASDSEAASPGSDRRLTKLAERAHGNRYARSSGGPSRISHTYNGLSGTATWQRFILAGDRPPTEVSVGMTAAEEILDWSGSRPLWQRDALRRIVLKGELDQSDLAELVLIAKEQRGVTESNASPPAAVPLASSHLPTSGMAQAVSLSAITDVQNVNALAHGQELSFQSQGLTVVYGDNATGKSGYVRILKKVCRARAADTPILPNVFEASTGAPPHATIRFEVGSAPSDFSWEEGTPSPDDVAAVSVFDSPSAAVYASSTTDVAYLPFGLDLLTRLAAACDDVAAELREQMAAESCQLDRMLPALCETPSGQWLSSISASTSVDEIDAHTALSAQHDESRERLRKVLSEQNPEQRAAEFEAKRGRFQTLQSRLSTASGAVTSSSVEQLADTHRELREAERASGLATAQRFGGFPIPNVGSERWERLWEAAQAFSQEIHLRHQAEVLEDPRRCPLCQRALDKDAEARFEAFADYFLVKTESEEAIKRQAFLQARDLLTQPDLAEDLYQETIEELRIEHTSVAGDIDSYLRDCRAIQLFAEAASPEAELPGLPSVPSFDARPLRSITDSLLTQVAELRAVSDPERNRVLQSRALELEGKQWLAERREQIIAEVQRKIRHTQIELALSDTVTTGITHKSTELTQRYVTDELRAAFSSELANIAGEAPRVELIGQAGEKGISYYRLELSGATLTGTGIEPVLSEGELRAISLAAFLSELSTEETKSAVVLDDPISSLDVQNRERVAERIATLASERQVIVFTHDLFFLVTLVEQAESQEVPSSTLMLVRSPVGAGVVTEDVPWEAKKFNQLIGALRKQCQTARAAPAKDDPSIYEAVTTKICSDLRKTVERTVEEVLLSRIVMRYQRQLRLANIKNLAAIDRDDIVLLDHLMTKYSKYAHSQSPETRIPPPSIDEIEGDVETLDAWAGTFRKKVGS